jgi:CCR4-NOT transcription complex subunit 1
MTILMMNENQTFTAEELSFSRLAKASYQGSNIPDLPTVTPAEPKPSGWNYHIFIKGVNDYLKINWVQVLKQLDCPELTFSNKKSFQEFLNVCDILKDTSKVVFPRELFIGKWENARSQLYFLDRFIEVTQTQEVSIYRDMKNKNLIEYDSSSSARNNSSQAISDQEEEVWLNKDIITRLIELSDSKYYSLVKSLFELPMRRCPEIILASLSQVNPRCGTNLLEEIFSILLSEILENASSHTKILEYVSRNNFDLLTNTLAEICRKENSSLNLSRILDISQTLKGSFLQRLAASEDFGFSIPLGLFASKREFVNLKTWIKERIDTSGDRFVQALVSYIHSHILVPILSIQSREGLVQATPKRLDILFETSHLNAGNLNIIMEALTQINSLRGKFSEKVLRSIESLQTELQKVLPDNFNSVTTTELEKESDRRLSEVYEGKVTLKAFINDLIQLKNSPRSQDKEVNACIIHNLIEEYPNYRNQNRPSIELTGRIFGNLIKEKIAPDVAHKICIQCFMDALNKKDRMLYMGISALKELQPVIHEPQYHHLCKKIFEIDQLRENHYELLYEILQNLKKTKNNMIIPDQYAIEVTNRHDQDAQKRKDQVPPSQPNTAQESESQHNLNASISNNQSSPTGSQNRKEIQHQPPQPTGPPPLINVDEIESTTLQEEYHKKYTQEVEFLQVSDQERRDNVFFLNNLSKDKLDEKARLLQNKLTDNDTITWFGCYLVWKCVPKDKQLLEMYSEFLNRLDKKSMTKKVLSSTYILLNLSFEYMTHKKSPSPDEMAIVRNCGTWLGLITLAKNKPIIKRELDLKLRLYKSLENKSLSKTLPILVHILASVNKSTIFKTFNPYIMGILGILIEIRADLSDRENVTVQIATLLRELNINERAERDIKHFNYIEKKRNNRTQQGRSSQFFNLRSLPESITIDMASLEAHIAGYDVDLRQLGAMAVDLSITDITKPLINQRSGVIAIGTTIELVLKDCAFEPSEEKLIQCAEAMVCKLVRSLTMATCVELLKGSIKSYMDHFLETQTQLPEQSRKAIKEIVALDNFQMACSIVARIVVENTLHELRQDPLMVDAIERRKLARQNNDKSFIDQRYVQYSQHIPPAIKPNPNGLTREELNVYLSMIEQPPMVNRPEMMGRRHPQPPAQGQPQTYPQDRRVLEERVGVDQLDENKIKNLLLDLDKFLSSATDESKFVAIQNVYSTLSKLLQQARDVEVHIPSLTMMILEAIFKPAHQVSSDKLRYYCDILAIYNSYSVKVTKYITEWYFESNSENKFSHQILIIFLRRNLLLISEFDAKYAILLDQVDAHNLAPLDCIVLVLKYLVIEHRIFMIYTFKKIVEKLISFQRKRFFNNVSQESMIFIENLSEFMKTNNDYTSAIKFRLTHIESDYKKLHQDVEEYFHRPDYAFYRLSIQLLKKWLMAKSELEMAQFIRSFEEEITRKSDKATISFFCYIIDVACKQAER